MIKNNLINVLSAYGMYLSPCELFCDTPEWCSYRKSGIRKFSSSAELKNLDRVVKRCYYPSAPDSITPGYNNPGGSECATSVENLCQDGKVLDENESFKYPQGPHNVPIVGVENKSNLEYKITVPKNITPSGLGLNKDLIKISSIGPKFNSLPISFNDSIYGKELDVKICENGVIKSLMIKDKDFIKDVKRMRKWVHKDFEGFREDTRFYYDIKVPSLPRIVVVRYIKKDKNEFKKSIDIYTEGGVIIQENIVDEAYNLPEGWEHFIERNISDKVSVVREINNVRFVFERGEATRTEIKHKLPPLKVHNTKVKDSPDLRIGALDLETYKDEEGISKVYALGFTTLDMESSGSDKCKTYFLNKDANNSNDLVIKCVEDMLQYNNHTFYVNNLGGGIDSSFIIKTLEDYNILKGVKYFDIDCVFRDKPLRFRIKRARPLWGRGNNTPKAWSKIDLIDSCNILTGSLEWLAKGFDVKYKKGHFPHRFVQVSTLNYEGDTPSIEYYKSEKGDMEVEIYKKLQTKHWSLREECLKYLQSDILSLLYVMYEFTNQIWKLFLVDVTKSLTISRLGLDILLKKFYNPTGPHPIGVVNKTKMYREIKEGYTGGIVEVYKPKSKDSFLVVCNSLYPYAALGDMPGNECTYIEDRKPIDLTNRFGFYWCTFESPKNSYFGLLPVRLNGGIVLPNGKTEALLCTEEIHLALSEGYKIESYRGYEFNRIPSPFKIYINYLYNMKRNTTGAKRQIAMFLLNVAIGSFGMNIEIPITKMVDYKTHLEILNTHKITRDPIKMGENKYLITYEANISEEVCTQQNLRYREVLNNKSNKDLEIVNQFDDVSIPIAAFVTSRARVVMNKMKLALHKKGTTIYYTDTDSLVIDKMLPNELMGDDIGEFKLEKIIKEGIFISGKTYCLVLSNGEVKIVAKGVSDNSMSYEIFKDLEAGRPIPSGAGIVKGYSSIDSKEVNLNAHAYKNRIKVYDEDGNWIDTKPLDIVLDKYLSSSKLFILINYGLNPLSHLYKMIYGCSTIQLSLRSTTIRLLPESSNSLENCSSVYPLPDSENSSDKNSGNLFKFQLIKDIINSFLFLYSITITSAFLLSYILDYLTNYLPITIKVDRTLTEVQWLKIECDSEIDTYEIGSLDAPSILEPYQIMKPLETNIVNSIEFGDIINYIPPGNIIDEWLPSLTTIVGSIMGVLLLVYGYKWLLHNSSQPPSINNDSTLDILTHPISNIGVDQRDIIRGLLSQVQDQPRLLIYLREQLDYLSLQYIYSQLHINPDISVSEIINLLNTNVVANSITTQEAIQAIIRFDIRGENISQILHEMNRTLVPHNQLIPSVEPEGIWSSLEEILLVIYYYYYR